MTFSIAGFDPKTGELGVAVASKFLAAASLVPFAKAGVGAVATQSWVNLNYGIKGLEYMEQGLTAEEALEKAKGDDVNRAVRQVGFVDAKGNSATFTGEECHSWAGGIAGKNFAAQGNILTDENVVKKMAEAFENTEGDLATKLLQALLAGDEAGGDSRGKQSAGILVVKENGSYGGYTDKYIDLRVDDHEEPVQELLRIYNLHQLYFGGTLEQDVVKVESDLKDKISSLLTKLDYFKSEVTDESILEGLHRFHLIENFDERIQEKGYVDIKVVQFMEGLAARKD